MGVRCREDIVEYYPTSKDITIGLILALCYDKDKEILDEIYN